ncbi:CLIP-associated protein isoform X2 [Cucumis melo var. makuwa]|uniref:CLIP-associated protein isoform X2 n=1 Tax=Cucumis melo var. makuwa TaxID=1194695 RepID=A0A5D3C8Z5_CUCMM|nr:CLIP-associated protein isoform X2 [Cucumis melo var. makuwa]
MSTENERERVRRREKHSSPSVARCCPSLRPQLQLQPSSVRSSPPTFSLLSFKFFSLHSHFFRIPFVTLCTVKPIGGGYCVGKIDEAFPTLWITSGKTAPGEAFPTHFPTFVPTPRTASGDPFPTYFSLPSMFFDIEKILISSSSPLLSLPQSHSTSSNSSLLLSFLFPAISPPRSHSLSLPSFSPEPSLPFHFPTSHSLLHATPPLPSLSPPNSTLSSPDLTLALPDPSPSTPVMEEALELARAKDTKERMAGVERLYELLEASRKSLNSAETTSLVDCCLDLLKDNNFRVSQGALQALASAAVLSGDHLKLHFNALVPAAVERLGDAKQPVREAARRLLLTLMEISSPTIIVERAGSYAWSHKSWRIREEFARTVTSAIGLFASTELTLQRAVLPSILQMLNDPNPGVREAAIVCIEEMYTQAGPQLRDELQRHHLPTYMVKDINARLEKITPQVRSSEGLTGSFAVADMKPVNINSKKNSPKAKSSNREVSLFGGETDVTEKQIDPVKVYSEKELIREIEKITSILVPDKDWSIRIAAMQRVEGLVSGGAADYPSFRGLLKQLVGPLSTQLSDRRSSIVKQISICVPMPLDISCARFVLSSVVI